METLEKKLIELSYQYVDSSYLEGDINVVVETLFQLERDFRGAVETEWGASLTLGIELIIKLEMDYDYDDGKVLYLKAYRYETDGEFKLRIDAKQSEEDKVRQRELATLAKLKAKYGDVS